MLTITRALAVAGSAIISLPNPASSVEWGEEVAEAEWDWRPGDLIFRNDVNSFDDRLAKANGWRWASVGILRASSAGPRVVFASEQDGVTEVTLDGFVANISQDEYAVYRVTQFTTKDAAGEITQGPLVRYSMFIAYGAAYDPQALFGNGTYYNAELPFEAALSAGVTLGDTTTIEDLAGAENDIRDLFLQKMENHPYCVVAMNRDECWNEIRTISVVTTETIMSSDLLVRLDFEGR